MVAAIYCIEGLPLLYGAAIGAVAALSDTVNQYLSEEQRKKEQLGNEGPTLLTGEARTDEIKAKRNGWKQGLVTIDEPYEDDEEEKSLSPTKARKPLAEIANKENTPSNTPLNTPRRT